MATKFGAVDEANTVKAGCGIRYDPEQLGEDSGFDFSAAEQMKPPISEEQNEAQQEEEPKPHTSRNTQDNY